MKKKNFCISKNTHTLYNDNNNTIQQYAILQFASPFQKNVYVMPIVVTTYKMYFI